MSEEEKQAIDTLQNCIADYVIGDYCVGKYCPQEDACKNDDCPFENAIETVLNLIEKQQKQIEEKSKKYVDLCFEAGKIKADLDIAERVIDKMAEKLSNTMTKSAYEVNWNNDYANGQVYMKKEEIKDYFYKEIEDEK